MRTPWLKRHKGPTLEVPKCRYFFGSSRRRDITPQKFCEMKNLEDGPWTSDLRPRISEFGLRSFAELTTSKVGGLRSESGFTRSSDGTAARHWSRRNRTS